MNVIGIVGASLGAFVAYFAVGGLAFGLLPWLKTELLKYPNVYRSQEGIKSTMPVGTAFMFLAMVVLVMLYAMSYQGRSGAIEGARFAVLIGVFDLGAFSVHNYVHLRIGGTLAFLQDLLI